MPVHVYVCAHEFIPTWDHRSTLHVILIPQNSSTLSSETGSLSVLELPNSIRLAGQWTPVIHLSLPPQNWDCKCHYASLLMWVLGIELRSSCICNKHFTNYLSGPQNYLFNSGLGRWGHTCRSPNPHTGWSGIQNSWGHSGWSVACAMCRTTRHKMCFFSPGGSLWY